MCISEACSLLVTIVNSCAFYWQCLQSVATSVYPDLTCSRLRPTRKRRKIKEFPESPCHLRPWLWHWEVCGAFPFSPKPWEPADCCIRTRCVPMSVSMHLWIRPLGLSPLVRWGKSDPSRPQSLQPCRQEGLAIGFSCDPPPQSSLRQTVFKVYMAYAIISANTLQLRGSGVEGEEERTEVVKGEKLQWRKN